MNRTRLSPLRTATNDESITLLKSSMYFGMAKKACDYSFPQPGTIHSEWTPLYSLAGNHRYIVVFETPRTTLSWLIMRPRLRLYWITLRSNKCNASNRFTSDSSISLITRIQVVSHTKVLKRVFNSSLVAHLFSAAISFRFAPIIQVGKPVLFLCCQDM